MEAPAASFSQPRPAASAFSIHAHLIETSAQPSPRASHRRGHYGGALYWRVLGHREGRPSTARTTGIVQARSVGGSDSNGLARSSDGSRCDERSAARSADVRHGARTGTKIWLPNTAWPQRYSWSHVTSLFSDHRDPENPRRTLRMVPIGMHRTFRARTVAARPAKPFSAEVRSSRFRFAGWKHHPVSAFCCRHRPTTTGSPPRHPPPAYVFFGIRSFPDPHRAGLIPIWALRRSRDARRKSADHGANAAGGLIQDHSRTRSREVYAKGNGQCLASRSCSASRGAHWSANAGRSRR